MTCFSPRMPSSGAGVTAGEGCTVASIVLQTRGAGTSPRQAQYPGGSWQQILTMMHEWWKVATRTCSDFSACSDFSVIQLPNDKSHECITFLSLTFTARNPHIAVPVFRPQTVINLNWNSLKTTNLYRFIRACPLWSANISSISEVHC